MSYYDVDAILTDAEKVPCTFELDLPDLGYLDNTPSQPIRAGTQLALPLWLAELLALRGGDGGPESKSFVTLNLPPALSDDVVQALKADPRAVALRDQSPHLYALAARMLDLFEEPDLAAALRDAFAVRAAEVALHARKAGASAAVPGGGGTADDGGSNLGAGGAGEEFLRGLDEWERKLFRRAHDGTKAGKEWMDGVKKH